MNAVRTLSIAGLGDREAPIGPNLRRGEMGEDRFKSVLSRIARSVSEEVASLDAEKVIASGPASSVPDARLRKPETGEEIPDEDLAGGAANALHTAERQVGMLPNRPEANQEFLRAASEPGVHRPILPVPSPINDGMTAPGAVLVDLPASDAPSAAGIGPSDLLLDVPEAAGNNPAAPSGAEEPLLSATVGGFRLPGLDKASPAAISGEPSGRPTELMPVQGDHAAEDTEFGRRPTPPELPRVTVISRETHFAPPERPDPARLAIQPYNLPPDTSDNLAEGQTAAPDAPPRNERLAQTENLLWAPIEPKSRPQNQEDGPPPYVPARAAAAVPTSTVTVISSTEGVAAPPGAAGAGQGLLQGVATLPELSRAPVISQEKPSAPARRLDPARPVTSGRQPEPPRSPVTGLAPVGPEAAARSVRPVAENLPPSPMVPGSPIEPGSMPQLSKRDETGRQPAGVVPAAASATIASTEGVLTPTSGVAGLGQDVLQRISGAVVEAAGSATLSTAAPVATAGIADDALASAPTRALTIRIDLHEHGAVHVRLALNGNALSLRMRADREEVAEQLRQDHLKLSDTLSAAGYDTEIVAIEGRRNEVTPLPGNDTSSPAGAGANDAANADRGAGGDNRRPTARQAPDQGFGEDFFPHDQEDHEPRNIAQRRAGALYV